MQETCSELAASSSARHAGGLSFRAPLARPEQGVGCVVGVRAQGAWFNHVAHFLNPLARKSGAATLGPCLWHSLLFVSLLRRRGSLVLLPVQAKALIWRLLFPRAYLGLFCHPACPLLPSSIAHLHHLHRPLRHAPYLPPALFRSNTRSHITASAPQDSRRNLHQLPANTTRTLKASSHLPWARRRIARTLSFACRIASLTENWERITTRLPTLGTPLQHHSIRTQPLNA